MTVVPDPLLVTRRRFCGSLAACTLGAACSSSPVSPTAAAPPAPTSAAPVPDAGPADSPALPQGPAGPLPVLQGRGAAGQLVLSIEGTALSVLGGVARIEGEVNGLHHYVLVTRSTASTVAALRGICTHEGCVVNRFVAPAFECPCHGSQYDWQGAVLRGPAPTALPRLDARLDASQLTIRV